MNISLSYICVYVCVCVCVYSFAQSGSKAHDEMSVTFMQKKIIKAERKPQLHLYQIVHNLLNNDLFRLHLLSSCLKKVYYCMYYDKIPTARSQSEPGLHFWEKTNKQTKKTGKGDNNPVKTANSIFTTLSTS